MQFLYNTLFPVLTITLLIYPVYKKQKPYLSLRNRALDNQVIIPPVYSCSNRCVLCLDHRAMPTY